MPHVKRNWDLLTEEERKTAIEEIINYYSTEKNEEIGVIAAGNLLDMFLEATATQIYNTGLEDTKAFVKARMEEVEVDIEASLKK